MRLDLIRQFSCLYSVFRPSESLADSLLPLLELSFSGIFFHLRNEFLVESPVLDDILLAVPEAHCKACQVGSAHSGGLDALRPLDLRVDDIGLELHQEVVLASAAVDFQSAQPYAGSLFHSCQDIAGLECQGLKGSTDQVIFVDTAGKSDNRSASVGIPVRSAQAGECGNDIAAVGILDSGREVLGIRRLVNELELVAQPLDSRACYEYGTFQSVLDLAVKAPCDGFSPMFISMKQPVP